MPQSAVPLAQIVEPLPYCRPERRLHVKHPMRPDDLGYPKLSSDAEQDAEIRSLYMFVADCNSECYDMRLVNKYAVPHADR